MNVRLRRLESDWNAVSDALKNHPRIRIESTAGSPPQRYCLAYNIKGLVEQADGTIVEKDEHLVEISLLRGYPRQAPVCRMLTPVYHPNIAPHVICIGDDWSAGESLLQLIFRIGEMIAFQSYNIKSPLNGAAARWVEEHIDRLPVDKSSLLPPERPPSSPTVTPERTPSHKPAATPPPASSTAPDDNFEPAPDPAPLKPPAPLVFRCGACSAKLTAEQHHAGKKIQCPKCQAVCRIPGAG